MATAEETTVRINEELKELQETLNNIEQARSFDDLTVEDVGEAHPHLRQTVDTMMKKGKWTVPGQFTTLQSRIFAHSTCYLFFLRKNFRLQGEIRRVGTRIGIVDNRIISKRKISKIFSRRSSCAESRVCTHVKKKPTRFAKSNA